MTGHALLNPILIACLISCYAISCTEIFVSSSYFDSRRVTVQLLTLFNQRTTLTNQNHQWRGDWVFRRERLDLIDKGLRNVKPDIVIFQEMMVRQNSLTESDQTILSAGSLLGYQWAFHDIQEYYDTEELEKAAVAIGLPLKLTTDEQLNTYFRNFENGYIAPFIANHEGQNIAIINFQEPSTHNASWFDLLESHTKHFLSEKGICSKRLIMAGNIHSEASEESLRTLLQELNLKDLAEGLCEQESTCYTATSINELYYLTNGDKLPTRKDRIFVHKDTIVYFSERNFDDTSLFPYRLRSNYSMTQIWPSYRFGWVATIRLPRCQSNL